MRSLFLIAVAAVATLMQSCSEAPPQSTAPNVIVLLADDLGYNDLSCYRSANAPQGGNTPTCQTPHIDGLAASGMRFTDFYSGAAVCSPSRAALLTGRNKTRLGIYNWIPPNSPMHLEAAETTIAEMLKANGYATAHFGKWHLTSANMSQPEPLDQGFDYAFWTHNNAQPSHENPINFIKNREEVGELQGYSCHLVVEEAMQWLEGQQQNNQPFYLNIWFHEPHAKEAAPDSLKNRHQRLKAYYGCIENMDYAVGKLLDYLNEQGLDENTVIVFASDNGSQYVGSNDPLRGEKCYQYEGGIRTPFIAHWKGRIPEGKTSDFTGHFTDLLPTLANLTQSQIPEGLLVDGEDLSAVLQGKPGVKQRQSPLFFYRYFHDPVCMLREGDLVLLGYVEPPLPWAEDYDQKATALFQPEEGTPRWSQWNFQENHMEALLEQAPQYFELYDLSEDPSQRNDIAQSQAETVARMKTTMLKLRTEMVAEGGNWFAHP